MNRGPSLHRSGRRWLPVRRASPRLLMLLSALAAGAGPVGDVVAQGPPSPSLPLLAPDVRGAAFLPSPGEAGSGADSATYPTFRTRREVTIVSLGSAAFLAGALTPLAPPAIPWEGFDPSILRWSIDRESIRPAHASARRWSDVTDAAALMLPLSVAATWEDGNPRWERLARTAALQAEVLLVAQGTVLLAKRLVARPRPCTFLALGLRVEGGHCDGSRTRTFQSMPSGHASSAWAGASMALTEQLLSRPEAEWMEHAGVGALAGLLATTTSVLRVSAGEHFVSDVLLGSGIGILTGVTLPILHRGERPWPSRGAVLQGFGGLIVGSLAGSFVVHLF